MSRSRVLLSMLGLVAGIGVSAVASAADLARSRDGAWAVIEKMPDEASRAEAWIRPELGGVPLRLDTARLRQVLADAPKEGTPEGARGAFIVDLPTPDGGFAAFRVVESPVMDPELAAKFPEIKTYLGQGVEDGAATVRFSMTPAGFAAQVLSPEGAYYVDAYTRGDDTLYTSYKRDDYRKELPEFECFTIHDDGKDRLVPGARAGGLGDETLGRAGANLRTYRLAVNATGEYTAFHGGTVAGGLAAVVTVVNRINGIYENEFCSRLVLVANNNLLIYTNAGTDPFTTPGANSTTNTQSTSNINTVIGSTNYDVGHVFHRGANNGLAGAIGNVCSATKGGGTSVTEPPVGDLFAVDYVAHEMGHQFGMRHNFNNCNGSQGDASSLANEPGSGTTIMGYAGICGPTNVQSNSDPYFNNINFDQFLVYQSGTGGCPIPVATGNNVPVVSAGPDYVIPRQTPFTLTASASDADPTDVLTYNWEVREGGSAITLGTDNGSSPIMRSRLATTSPSRTIPRLSNLLANTFDTGEFLYQNARTQTWRVTVRDNRAGGGAINTDDMILTVANAGPFQVTSPNTNVTWSGFQTVTWNVNGTNVAPVNTANVRILLSTDGGNTFPIVLASSTPNDGSESVLLPDLSSNQARIRVEAIGNIYFDVSNTNFTLTFTPPGVSLVGTGGNTASDADPVGNNNGVLEPGEASIAVNVGLLNAGATTATGVTGTLVSLTPTVTVTTPVAAYPNLALGASATNLTPFRIAIAPEHPCGGPIALQLVPSSTEGGAGSGVAVNFTTGTSLISTVTRSYTGPAVFIPDNNATGATATLNVTGVGTISDLNFRFDGSACSAAIGSTTVGLDHTFVGDLVITLISPQGTSVVLSNRRGVGGNNFCNTLFDDDGGFPSISTITAAGNPYTGNFAPESPLSAFDGQNGSGNWQLRVVDLAGTDTGNIRAFTLIFTAGSGFSCQPPLAPVDCVGDADGSGVVDFSDITTVLANFGAVTAPFGTGDANGSGLVDFSDITTVLANFGATCS